MCFSDLSLLFICVLFIAAMLPITLIFISLQEHCRRNVLFKGKVDWSAWKKPEDCWYKTFQASARPILTNLQMIQRFLGDEMHKTWLFQI